MTKDYKYSVLEIKEGFTLHGDLGQIILLQGPCCLSVQWMNKLSVGQHFMKVSLLWVSDAETNVSLFQCTSYNTVNPWSDCETVGPWAQTCKKTPTPSTTEHGPREKQRPQATRRWPLFLCLQSCLCFACSVSVSEVDLRCGDWKRQTAPTHSRLNFDFVCWHYIDRFH